MERSSNELLYIYWTHAQQQLHLMQNSAKLIPQKT